MEVTLSHYIVLLVRVEQAPSVTYPSPPQSGAMQLGVFIFFDLSRFALYGLFTLFLNAFAVLERGKRSLVVLSQVLFVLLAKACRAHAGGVLVLGVATGSERLCP